MIMELFAIYRPKERLFYVGIDHPTNWEPHFHGSPPPGSAMTREDAESVCAAIAERNRTRREDYPDSKDLVVQIVPLR